MNNMNTKTKIIIWSKINVFIDLLLLYMLSLVVIMLEERGSIYANNELVPSSSCREYPSVYYYQ